MDICNKLTLSIIHHVKGELVKFLIAAVTILIISSGCTEKDKSATRQKETAVADESRLALSSETVIKKFSTDLKSALMAAIKKSGVASAIDECNTAAPVIGAKYSGEYVRIYRVSDRRRNPDNAANQHQLDILSSFSDTATDLKSSLEWTTDGNQKVFTYYKPIRTNSLCLKCHGDKTSIADDVLAAIEEKYPDDEATGYQAGELRGMFVVEMKWPDAKEFLEEMDKKQ